MDITKLNTREEAVINLLVNSGKTVEKMTRNSKVEYDIDIHGYNSKLKCEYSAWLPLAVIQEANWSQYIEMSDYPGMVGDWSAIRDSEDEAIMNILKQALSDLGLTK